MLFLLSLSVCMYVMYVCMYVMYVCVCLQRVVKADIVNYSQEPMARTVNPPRSSMCTIQWPPLSCNHHPYLHPPSLPPTHTPLPSCPSGCWKPPLLFPSVTSLLHKSTMAARTFTRLHPQTASKLHSQTPHIHTCTHTPEKTTPNCSLSLLFFSVKRTLPPTFDTHTRTHTDTCILSHKGTPKHTQTFPSAQTLSLSNITPHVCEHVFRQTRETIKQCLICWGACWRFEGNKQS